MRTFEPCGVGYNFVLQTCVAVTSRKRPYFHGQTWEHTFEKPLKKHENPKNHVFFRAPPPLFFLVFSLKM